MPEAQTVVAVWERGREQHPVDRALTILAAATGTSRSELSTFSVAQRDAYLMQLRSAWFGADIDALVDCPQCACQIEVHVTIGDIVFPPDPEATGFVNIGGTDVQYRLPTSHDLAEIVNASDVESARATLARRCLPRDVTIDETAIDTLDEALADRSEYSRVDISLTCAECGNDWRVPLDIASLLWSELASEARSLLVDVDALASRYGWSEAEVFALSPQRRRTYLEFAQ